MTDVEEPKDIRSRKDRPTGSTHIGDVDFFEENPEDIGDATWGEVFQGCCCHTPQEWFVIFIGLIVLCFFLYFFLLGLDLLGNAAKVIGGCTAGNLLGDETNPIAALMIGILATVLLQSSSTTTSIVVSLVGADTIATRQAIYMIMGANIGTSVTNTIVAMGQMGDGDQLERAFAGATVHDMFNFLTVGILLPIEAATGFLFRVTEAMVANIELQDGEKWTGPIKRIVGPLTKMIIIANKKVIEGVAAGDSCDDFYPINCTDPSNPTKSTCSKRGLIDCDKSTDRCPAFFDVDATQQDDQVAGGVCFFVALVVLVICLIGLVTLLQRMLLGMSTRVIHKATNINGYLAILIGVGVTILVQSSSITTSTLTPLVGMGLLQLEQMLPLTLGANIGTTVTALLASLVGTKIDALQVALAHLMFNITGIAIWYPLPFMRRIPLGAARNLGKATRLWRGFPLVYIAVTFFLGPLALLGIAALFEQNKTGFTILGSMLVILIVAGIAYYVYWWRFRGGRDSCVGCLDRRQRKMASVNALPDDMEYVKEQISLLREHTGLPSADEAAEEEEVAKKLDDDDDDKEQEETEYEEAAVFLGKVAGDESESEFEVAC